MLEQHWFPLVRDGRDLDKLVLVAILCGALGTSNMGLYCYVSGNPVVTVWVFYKSPYLVGVLVVTDYSWGLQGSCSCNYGAALLVRYLEPCQLS